MKRNPSIITDQIITTNLETLDKEILEEIAKKIGIFMALQELKKPCHIDLITCI